MKVLHVIPSISKVHGGPSKALAIMERALSEAGVAVATATTDDDGPGRRLSKAQQLGIANGAERYYARKWSEFYKCAPGLLIWLLRHCRRFDAVHIHALFSFSSVAAAFAAWLASVPYVVRPLGTLNAYGVSKRRPFLKKISFGLIERRILKHAAAVHFTSQAEWDEAKALGVPMRGVVVPLGVVGPAASRSNVAPFAVAPGRKVILFLSRLDPKKNVEGLLRAFGQVRVRHANAVLVIAGGGVAEYVAALRSLATTLGLDGAVIWTGHIDGEQKWGAFDAADIFVLPSFSENFGIAAAEALAAGLPCVLGRGVAIAQSIADAGAGLVSAPDAPSIAENLDRLLGDPAECQKLGGRGRAVAEREYSAKAMAGRLVEVYAGIRWPMKCAPNDVVLSPSQPAAPPMPIRSVTTGPKT